MKKSFILATAIFAALSMNARVFNVGTMTRVDGAFVDKPVISADGSFVVGQNNVKGGIQKIDLSNGEQTTIVEGQGLYNLALSPDGNTVAFTRPTFNDQHLRFNSVEAADMTTGNVQTVVKASRDLSSGLTVTNEGVSAVNKGRQSVKGLKGKAKSAPVVAINYGHLTLTVDGRTTILDPQGKGSYLWPSISPDGTKIVYWLVYRGCFVCDLDGSNPRQMGGIRAAVWAGNDAVIGVESVEGENMEPIASSLVAVDINTNERQTLTDETVLAEYPSVNADATRVAFADIDGQLYILDINK